MAGYPALCAAIKDNPAAVAELRLLRRELKRLEGLVAKLETAATTVDIRLHPARLDEAYVVADRACDVLIRDISAPTTGGDTGSARGREQRYHYSAGVHRQCAKNVRKALREGVDGISILTID
jgi:hypothetical protein